MVKRREEYPVKGEFVIGTVKDVNPNSVFIHLNEYNKDGMIHISEVAKKWVKDTRNWVSKGDKIVCKVKDIREDKGHIDLSLKDVSDRDRNRRMQAWKRDQRGEKLLNKIAETEEISINDAYQKIGFDLQENFRDMLEPFEIAIKKGVDELVKRDISKNWAQIIKSIAEENIKIKDKKITKEINITSWESDGLDMLKNTFSDLKEEFDIDITYISAPKYELSIKTKDLKQGQETLNMVADKVKEMFADKNVEVKTP